MWSQLGRANFCVYLGIEVLSLLLDSTISTNLTELFGKIVKRPSTLIFSVLPFIMFSNIFHSPAPHELDARATRIASEKHHNKASITAFMESVLEELKSPPVWVPVLPSPLPSEPSEPSRSTARLPDSPFSPSNRFHSCFPLSSLLLLLFLSYSPTPHKPAVESIKQLSLLSIRAYVLIFSRLIHFHWIILKFLYRQSIYKFNKMSDFHIRYKKSWIF